MSTKANAEGFILEKDISGFIFSPDFDTSQEMAISKFMKKFYARENDIVKTSITYNDLVVPVILMGSNAKKYEQNKEYYLTPNMVDVYFSYSKRDIWNTKEMLLKRFSVHFDKMTLDGKEYLLGDKNLFIVEVFHDDCIAFILNPYVYLFEEDELIQKEGYKEGYMNLRKGSEIKNKYISNMSVRRQTYIKEFDNIFSNFVTNAKKNGFVIGAEKLFLRSGYLILTGTKEDSKISLNKKIFPYHEDENQLVRYTKKEIKQIEKEKAEYKKKCEIVRKRIEVLETLLKEKNLTYTVISDYNISFKDNGSYSVWMNAQVYDDAHSGWYTEQDFIDWLNMEGKIPYKRKKTKYFAKMLEEVSEGKYTFIKYEIVGDKKVSNYDDYDMVAIFKVKGLKKYQSYDLNTMKEKIEEIKPIEKYTLFDFEKNFSKNRKGKIC